MFTMALSQGVSVSVSKPEVPHWYYLHKIELLVSNQYNPADVQVVVLNLIQITN